MGKKFLIALVSSCMLACGCDTIKKVVGSGDSQSVASEPSDAIAVYVDRVPRVKPGVLMTIQVGAISQKPTVMQVQVDQRGEITLQYLLEEPIYCDGLTLEALKQKLVKAYQRFIKQPVVSVAFVPVDGNNGVSPYGTVTVLGEVAMPGPVNMPATMDLTVTKVLKLAGGLRPFADKGKIRVTSCDKDGNRRRTIVNLQEIGRNGDISKDISLRAGDVVWVPESWY